MWRFLRSSHRDCGRGVGPTSFTPEHGKTRGGGRRKLGLLGAHGYRSGHRAGHSDPRLASGQRVARRACGIGSYATAPALDSLPSLIAALPSARRSAASHLSPILMRVGGFHKYSFGGTWGRSPPACQRTCEPAGGRSDYCAFRQMHAGRGSPTLHLGFEPKRQPALQEWADESLLLQAYRSGSRHCNREET